MRTTRWVLAATCLLAGLALGKLLPWPDPHAQVWTGPGQREGAAVAAAYAPPPAAALPSLAPVVARVSPAVVQVVGLLGLDAIAESGSEDGDKNGSSGVQTGTGFIVNHKGLVVTARHVVVHASEVLVRIGSNKLERAELVGEDALTDLAVLRLSNPPRDLPVLEIGRSEDLQAGDWILTIGNPMNFVRSVTAGVVSYVGRYVRNYDLRVSNDFLQFSAPVNPGSSGSPVVGLDGRVVGVTTKAMDAAQGISFAIPSRTLKWVLDTLDASRDGHVHRGFLGIQFENFDGRDDNGGRRDGAQIMQVTEGEPAHRAGLRAGDVVLFLDDHTIANAGELYEHITCTAPGSTVRMTLLRGSKVLEPIAVVLGEVGPPPGDGNVR